MGVPPSLSSITIGDTFERAPDQTIADYTHLLVVVYHLQMSIDRRKAALFGAAAVVRLLLFTSFPGLPDLLTARVEISTPVTSFKRCRLARDVI
jgi:hypothetical protein